MAPSYKDLPPKPGKRTGQVPVYLAHAGHFDSGSTYASALPLMISQDGGETSSGNNFRLADLNRDKPEIGE